MYSHGAGLRIVSYTQREHVEDNGEANNLSAG